MSNEKKTYVIAFKRDAVDTEGKTRSELSEIFSKQTNAVLVEFKQALKDENIQDTEIKNVMPNLGMAVIETTEADIKAIEKLPMIRSTMENQRLYLPRRPRRGGSRPQ